MRENAKRLILPIAMATLLVALIASMIIFREKRETVNEVTLYGYFDTYVTIYDYTGGSKADFDASVALVDEALGKYNALFDIYDDAEYVVGIYEINARAGVAPVTVSEELIDFLEFSKEVHTITRGEVNVAMGAVLSLWHDAREAANKDPESAALPDTEALAHAAEHCDINSLVIDREAMTAYLSDPLSSLDVGAVAKGYAEERIAELLAARGCSGYLLDFGGNLRAIGEKPSGEGWTTGVENPSGTPAYSAIFGIKDTAVSTSGVYARYFVADGVRYHHIIDKDTLYPVNTFASVTAVVSDAGMADALSTALFCMSLADGQALISGIDGAGAVWVYPNGEVVKTENIK